MGPVSGFDSQIAALREPQWPMIPCSRQISGLAGFQTLFLGPTAEGGHGDRNLREIGRYLALQVVDPTLTPPIDLGCRQPSDAYQHVDRCHVVAIGKGRLGRLDHSIFELAPNCCGHREEFRSGHGGCPPILREAMVSGRRDVTPTRWRTGARATPQQLPPRLGDPARNACVLSGTSLAPRTIPVVMVKGGVHSRCTGLAPSRSETRRRLSRTPANWGRALERATR